MMNANAEDFPPDQYDFPTDPPGLRDVDAALRCSICTELFDGPVSLPCGHTFCSLCIRNSIEHSEKSECAQCRKEVQLSQLRPVQVIEDVVKAWNLARSPILQLVKRPVPKSCPSPTKKRKLDHYSPSSESIRTGERQEASNDQNAADFVDCPVCQEIVASSEINSHIDRCLGSSDPPTTKPKSRPKSSRDSSKNEWSKILGGGGKGAKGKEKVNTGTADPLPQPTYPTLKDKQLKDMLVKHDLPTTGNRDIWIARHKQWVLIFNSNLDRSPSLRHSIDHLRTELKKWEQQKGLGSNHKKPGQVKIRVDDSVAYQKAHKDQFASLVEAAKPKNKSKKLKVEDDDIDTSTTTSPREEPPSSIAGVPSSPGRQSPTASVMDM